MIIAVAGRGRRERREEGDGVRVLSGSHCWLDVDMIHDFRFWLKCCFRIGLGCGTKLEKTLLYGRAIFIYIIFLF